MGMEGDAYIATEPSSEYHGEDDMQRASTSLTTENQSMKIFSETFGSYKSPFMTKTSICATKTGFITTYLRFLSNIFCINSFKKTKVA